MINRVIWDFNGTILDDVDASVKTVNTVLKEYGLKELESREEYLSHFRFPIIEYYRSIGFDFTKYEYKEPADKWVAVYNSMEKDIPLRKGIVETVKALNEAGIKQTVLSVSENEMLRNQLSSRGILSLFDEVFGKDNVYGEGKTELAGHWAESHAGERPVFIGDTVHDLESANRIGCPCVLLKGGHTSNENLYKIGCRIIDEPNDVITIIMNGEL